MLNIIANGLGSYWDRKQSPGIVTHDLYSIKGSLIIKSIITLLGCITVLGVILNLHHLIRISDSRNIKQTDELSDESVKQTDESNDESTAEDRSKKKYKLYLKYLSSLSNSNFRTKGKDEEDQKIGGYSKEYLGEYSKNYMNIGKRSLRAYEKGIIRMNSSERNQLFKLKVDKDNKNNIILVYLGKPDDLLIKSIDFYKDLEYIRSKLIYNIKKKNYDRSKQNIINIKSSIKLIRMIIGPGEDKLLEDKETLGGREIITPGQDESNTVTPKGTTPDGHDFNLTDDGMNAESSCNGSSITTFGSNTDYDSYINNGYESLRIGGSLE